MGKSRCQNLGTNRIIFYVKPTNTLDHTQFVVLVTRTPGFTVRGQTGPHVGLSVLLPWEVRVMLDLWFEEVIVPFGSCHRALGGKMASPTTGLGQPLCVGRP